MKKYFTVLICTFVFLFNDISILNTNMFNKTKKKDERVLVKCELNTKVEEQESIEKEKVEEKVEEKEEDSAAIETSTTDDYIQEENSTTETNYENYGTYGRLYVSWFDVALYDYNVNTYSSSSLQTLVDNYDSAAYYITKGRLVLRTVLKATT